MRHSASRLTLFAIISTIETDLREIINDYLGTQRDILSFLGPELAQQCCDRFEKEYGQNSEFTLRQLSPYLDFADSYKVLNANAQFLPNDIAQYLKACTADLDKLVPIRNRVMHSRPLHFDDLATTLDIAENLLKNDSVQWSSLRATLEHLERDPSFVLGLEIPSHSIRNEKKHNLPIPDFDDTGFLGRRQQVAELVKLCLGAYPVISIVGDGGIGKTALALKVAYELLDSPTCPFEAIVWTSSKTTQLTAGEIKRIENAISDSLGVFQSIAGYLAGVAVNDPIAEVLDYLREFRILLVIDNLETVLDDRITSFLGQLPIGSKIVITSRIGVGAFEYPYKLQPMEQREAVDLLRALAKARGVSDLVRMDNARLANYCRRMKNSPGFIKWFVTAVQTGRRPEEVLANPSLFLDFCMSNVYQFISDKSRNVLRLMLCLPGKHSQAELAFLNDMEAMELQPALHELLRTNLVVMLSQSRGSSFETHYELSDLARSYLSKHHPAEPREFEVFTRRKRQLTAAGEELQAERKIDTYSYYSLKMRSKSDLIVAKYLVDALRQAADNGAYSEANDLVRKARGLAPEYFEVHRVEAIIKTLEGDYSASQYAYEAALELEPDYAPLRKWYGSFLMIYMSDVAGALDQFNLAIKLDPKSYVVQLEMARANLYLHNYEEAIRLIEDLSMRTDVPIREFRKVYDLYLQCYWRQADNCILKEQYDKAVEHLIRLGQVYEKIPTNVRDSRMREKISSAVPFAKACYDASDESDIAMRERAQQIISQFETLVGANNMRGVISQLPKGKDFGFIMTEDRTEIWFHFNNWQGIDSKMHLGARVRFAMGRNAKGACARSVVPEISDT